MARSSAAQPTMHITLCVALLLSLAGSSLGHAGYSRMSMTEREWSMEIPGYALPVVPLLEKEYQPPEGVCTGVEQSQVAFQGVYMGMLSTIPNMGDKLVGDIFPQVMAEATRALLHLPVEVKEQYVNREGPLDTLTCSDLSQGQPCKFVVVGGGSLMYMSGVCVWHSDKGLYLFGTGVEGAKPGENNTFRLARVPPNIMGGVRGPISERLLHVYRRHLPVLGDSGLLAGIYFVDGYRERLDKDEPYGQNLQDVVLTDGTSNVTLPGGRPVLVVSLKNNASSNMFEQGNVDWESPYPKLYMKLITQWSQKYQIVFQPCDYQAAQWHDKFQARLNGALPEGAVPALMHRNWVDFSHVLRLCAAADVSLHGRLHSGVMCNSVGTPAVFLSNNMKFQDYLSAMGLAHMRLNMPTDASFDVDALGHRIHDAVSRAHNEREQISSVLRSSQRESHKLHVRAMAAWLRGEDSLMEPLLARLSCCRGGVTIQQGTIYNNMMNIQVHCTEPAGDAAATVPGTEGQAGAR